MPELFEIGLRDPVATFQRAGEPDYTPIDWRAAHLGKLFLNLLIAFGDDMTRAKLRREGAIAMNAARLDPAVFDADSDPADIGMVPA